MLQLGEKPIEVCMWQRALLREMFRVVATLNNDRTIRRTDFIWIGSDIVESGTPDQCALLPAINRECGRIQHPASENPRRQAGAIPNS
jgi:hypothetical protein